MAAIEKDATSLGTTKPTMSPDLIVQVPEGVPAKELSYQEISDILEIPIGSVMSRLYYARKKLAKSLGEFR